MKIKLSLNKNKDDINLNIENEKVFEEHSFSCCYELLFNFKGKFKQFFFVLMIILVNNNIFLFIFNYIILYQNNFNKISLIEVENYLKRIIIMIIFIQMI